ncbi:hypothetical protein IAI10_16105 [Clostridium sp. 19966]|uniref:XF1762 family protein n=1 Tax=Clostridium sp. 19966 TaxID=2768166 RepID=UPI0028DD4986|nr:XF1762 family protein [Clostridium sp. 19966]MDT8718190.1 hypothetical protein [Clostridium sp. 19966]
MKYELQPISLNEAKIFVTKYHRHNVAPVGHKFSIGLNDGEKVIGVVIVGRPIARHRQDGYTLEVLRCCVLEGYKDACSMLYAVAWRVTRNLGYKKLITYTLKSEPGSSLKAAGYKIIGQTEYKPKGWNVPSRPRVITEKYPLEQKNIWGIS